MLSEDVHNEAPYSRRYAEKRADPQQTLPGLQHVDEHAKTPHNGAHFTSRPVARCRPESSSRFLGETCSDVGRQNQSVAAAAKLAIQINWRPSKRVSTSLCTLVAQLILNNVQFHFNNARRTQTWPKDSCYTPTAAPWTLARSSLTS